MKKLLLLLIVPLAGITIFASTRLADAAESEVTILKFEADWCGPCQEMKPVFSEVSKQFGSEVSFRSINVDSQPSVADAYSVRALPTVVAVKNGKEVGRKTGYMNAFKLKSFIKKHS